MMQLTMKRALVLAAVGGLALVGCSNSNTATSPEVDPVNVACDDDANLEATFSTESDGDGDVKSCTME